MGWVDFREPVNAWTHCLWLLLSLPATVLLWRRGRGDRIKQLSLLVFGLSLVACYAGSTMFHAVRLSPAQIDFFDMLDRMGIYLLIAGTTTPVAVVVLRGPWKWCTLTLTWLLAAIGMTLCLGLEELPRMLSTSIYLAMGWGFLFCYVVAVRALSHQALRPAVLGGVFYSVGALINLVRWPVFWKGIFGSHELFHLFVMAGSLAHFWFIYRVVAPYDRLGPEEVTSGGHGEERGLFPEPTLGPIPLPETGD